MWERGQLATALADTGAHLHAGNLVTDRVELSPTARDFLQASIRRDRLRRRSAITVLSVLLVVAVVAAGVAVLQQRAAVEQRNIAVSQRVAGQASGLRTINSALAAQLGLAAYQLVPTSEARGSVLSTFATPYSTQLAKHTGPVSSVAFSPDRRTLATASFDNIARLWETDVNRVADRICKTAWPTITTDEWAQYLPELPYRAPCGLGKRDGKARVPVSSR